MRHSMQYQSGFASPTHVLQSGTQPNDQGAFSVQQEQYQQQYSKLKQMQRKSTSPKQKNLNQISSPVPFGNSTNNQKNLTLRGNSTHNYYPQPYQPYQRTSTQTTTHSQHQSSQGPSLGNSLVTGYISPNKLSPKHQLQMLQSPTHSQTQQLIQPPTQQASSATWRRNTFQGGNTQPVQNSQNGQVQANYASTRVYTEAPQPQFKINPSKKIVFLTYSASLLDKIQKFYAIKYIKNCNAFTQ